VPDRPGAAPTVDLSGSLVVVTLRSGGAPADVSASVPLRRNRDFVLLQADSCCRALAQASRASLTLCRLSRWRTRRRRRAMWARCWRKPHLLAERPGL